MELREGQRIDGTGFANGNIEFTDTRGNLLFKTKKQGNKRRIAESKRGQTVFAFTRDPDACKF